MLRTGHAARSSAAAARHLKTALACARSLNFWTARRLTFRWNQTLRDKETRIHSRRFLRRPLRLPHGVEAVPSCTLIPRGWRSTEGAARASDCRVASPLPRPTWARATYTAVAQVAPDALRLPSTKCSASSVKRKLTSIMEHDR